MLFNSFEFLVFLPIVFSLYWFVFKKRGWQNFLVIAASYVFYGWWNWRFLVLIIFTSLCSYVSGLLIERYEGRHRVQKAVSAANIVLNLAVLGFFKYYNFFIENFSALLNSLFGYEPGWVTLQIILPVGISFYTFQALSYSIDVFRGKIKATHDPVEFFAYISFFPQLVAGPIERATSLLPQFQKERQFDYSTAADGLRQMLWGFFKKIVVADYCAYIVNQYWDTFQYQHGAMLILLGVLFTFQIYCDFSGYSDIAIGCARLFGINLMRNFNYPYFSRSIPEFWRRWHISLTSWFRDYVYFPLGGSRGTKAATVRNIFIVWAISGLWHGANWTFVCWGLFHSVILSIYFLFGIKSKYERDIAYGRILPSLREFFQVLLTFALAVVGWIIFRAESMGQVFAYFGAIIHNPFIQFSSVNVRAILTLCMCLGLTVIEWIQRGRQHALQLPESKFFDCKAVRWGVYFAGLFIILLCKGSSQTFIYFQF